MACFTVRKKMKFFKTVTLVPNLINYCVVSHQIFVFWFTVKFAQYGMKASCMEQELTHPLCKLQKHGCIIVLTGTCNSVTKLVIGN